MGMPDVVDFALMQEHGVKSYFHRWHTGRRSIDFSRLHGGFLGSEIARRLLKHLQNRRELDRDKATFANVIHLLTTGFNPKRVGVNAARSVSLANNNVIHLRLTEGARHFQK